MDWLIGHLVGDYIFQTDWMAINKRKSTWACVCHVLIYTACVALAVRIGSGKWWPWWALGITAVCHFMQDRTSFVAWFSRIKGSAQFVHPESRHFPWSLTLIDNTLHLVQLWATAILVAHASV